MCELFHIKLNQLNYTKISIFSEDVTTFFKNIIQQIIHYRDQNHISKKDVMQLLMLARNKTCEDDNRQTDDCDRTSRGGTPEKDEGKNLYFNLNNILFTY